MPDRVRNLQQPSAAAKAVVAGLPPPSVAVLGNGEIDKIRKLCDPPSQEEANRRAELRKISDERVKHWPNTIEASRLKKERARKERLEAEEARRVIIDQEEKALADAKKEAAIRNANLMLYEENDRIKAFKSKLFLATVLDEREKQLAVREEKEAIAKASEAYWDAVAAKALTEAEAKEAEKKKSIKDRANALKQQQLEQLEEIRKIKIAERDADRAEGKSIAHSVELGLAEEKANAAKLLEERKKNSIELIKINEKNKEWKAQRHQREKAEEAEIAEYAKLKEAQMLERKKRMDEKFKAKLGRRQALIDRQAEYLKQLKDATEEREMRAMRDFEREREEREGREQAARDRREAEMEEFAKQQKLRKELRLAKEEAERIRMQSVWKDRAQLLIEEELDERAQARSEAETLQRFHLLQAQEKRRQALHEKELEIEDGLKLQEAMKEEQEVYHAYVNSVMGEYVRHGRDSAIVAKAAKSRRAT
jgi:hypothetical protein